MPKIFDNIENIFCDGLEYTLKVSHRADFCVGYFNLRGWKKVAYLIDEWQGGDDNCCRLLVGMNKSPYELIKEGYSISETEEIDNKEALRLKKQLATEFKEQLTLGKPTEEDEIALRKLSKQIKGNKVKVKLFLRYPLHAKLYLLFREDQINPTIGYLGSSNLTLAGLSRQGELNVDVLEQDAANKLSKWFNDRWDDRWCIDISEELSEIIDTSWAADKLYHPFHIYLKIVYHLSREARSGIAEFKIPKVFQEELLEYQQKAVLVSAHHLNKREGVLIGDVVGLGKTITACALSKIFEDDFFLETLIICPKNITEMWEDYVHKYQLRAKVLSQSLVQSKLPTLRRYRIVIIDESHNLRNREGKRYRAIQEYIQQNESKTILLTATPYNKTFLDLSNQLRLFIEEDKDLGIVPEFYISSIGGKVQFSAKHQVPISSLSAFERSEFTDDWRELMRLYMVRRTRSFIKQNYATFDDLKNRFFLTFSDGRRSYFPDRIPKKAEFAFSLTDRNDQYARLYSQDVVDILNHLNLPRYGLGNHIEDKGPILPTEKENQIQDNLSRAGHRLKGFCRTNLFKRLESSGYAFLLSLTRHVLRNYLFIYAIENKLPLPIGPQEANVFDDLLEDEDDEGNAQFKELITDENGYYKHSESAYKILKGHKSSSLGWIRSELFNKSLLKLLHEDCKQIIKIIKKGKDWDAKKDRKLNVLYDIICKTHKDEKVLIFTQYADTANYIKEELDTRKIDSLACVTGDHDNPTSIAYKFSPESSERRESVKHSDEIRVLVSTDVLSEGQNLQDAHIILNYDLPWALIRLIQRAGRVDRIGQKSDKILCYSFLPEHGIDQIINLRARLKSRIKENAEVVGSDEVFFDGDPINIHDLYNEKSGLLDEAQDDEVDLASYAYQIWKNATDDDSTLLKTIPNLPNVVYATKSSGGETKPGVIVYARTYDDNDILTWLDEKGKLISQSQLTILRAAQCKPSTKPEYKIPNHHAIVAKGVEYIKDTESNIGGQLGKKSSVRYRVYMRLYRYFEDFKETLFITEELKKAFDEIYKYPLKELGREILGRQLKAGVSDDDLANLVVSLREDDKLCRVSEEEPKFRDPQIICSLGIKEL